MKIGQNHSGRPVRGGAALRHGARQRPGLGLRLGLRLRLGLSFQRQGERTRRAETFRLQCSADPADLEQLIALASPGTQLFALRVAPADGLRFEKFRTQIAKFKTEQGASSGRGK